MRVGVWTCREMYEYPTDTCCIPTPGEQYARANDVNEIRYALQSALEDPVLTKRAHQIYRKDRGCYDSS